jgi:hypothetical protein
VTEKTLGRQKKPGLERKNYLTEVKLRRYGEARLRGGVRLQLKVLFEDGTSETRFWDGQSRWASYTFETSAKAIMALVDPETIWLIDSNLSNNGRTLKAERRGIFRLTGQLLFWIQNFLQVVAALA